MKSEISYYNVLGVNQNASNHELRKAFCKLSIELHPDTTSLELEDAKNKFQKVLEAYENLNNPINVLNNLVMDANNQKLVGNRRPFSNGEMFSLFLLIIIILICLVFSIIIASFTGKQIDSIPTWLLR